ncbi:MULTISPECIES: PhoH family protein [unclassified Haematospirillum]|uniref:PhoH family protein n=1 Tax=unclassified Haematospirillum TaxID=2622088 RepID=UPI00143C432F|nr:MULTISPECIES: PhoH family protein [unclassified Haematospirillum]NKD55431.1 PhoH family protein [Haematospirillum sp. H4890]NKD75441.1 PhoH family protein [Haematospirillum sp. H4485]
MHGSFPKTGHPRTGSGKQRRFPIRISLTFAENTLLPLVYGAHNVNLERLEGNLGVSVSPVGNTLTLEGPDKAVVSARAVLESLYEEARRGHSIGFAEVDAAVRMLPVDPAAVIGAEGVEDLTIRTRKRPIVPRSPNQAEYVRLMHRHEMVFGLGPAGTGKTYMAVAMAVAMKIQGRVNRIVLSRPAVEAGERLGFLPGDMREKVDPYLRPLYDALHDMLPGEQIAKAMESREIEVAPLAFMRGRTLSDAFVILDEAQNTTPTQMKMFLTRLGENSRMVITGDLSQIDLPRGTQSGLKEACDILNGVPGIGFLRFDRNDVLRHELVSRIVHAYERRDQESNSHDTAGN